MKRNVSRRGRILLPNKKIKKRAAKNELSKRNVSKVKQNSAMCVFENRLNGAAGKINFKIRRRSDMIFRCFQVTVIFCCLNFGFCSENNDVLTLQDSLDISDDEASDRRRPSNTQEKDILLLDALGRRKGPYHSSYGSSQEDDSIMHLLGKSEYFL